MSIIRPKFVALDSSHLAALARDASARDAKRKEVAKAFIETFSAAGCVLLLCWHHFEELLRHRDNSVVAERIAFVRSLPMVTWIASLTGDAGPGSIVDILGHEVAVAFREPHAGAQMIRDAVVGRLFRCGSGKDVVETICAAWQQLQPTIWQREERERELVAIARSDFVSISNTRVVDWFKGQLQSSADAERQLAFLSERLAQDIRERGDKRIPDAQRSAAQFIDSVRAEGAALLPDVSNPALQILLAQGIMLSDIKPETTLGEICELAAFRRRLWIVNEILGLAWPQLTSHVAEGRLPSCIIESGLRRYSQDLSERKGSELTDRYLACLSPYAGVTYVDKRTHENFKRASRQSPEFAALVRRVEKAADYQDIGRQLAPECPSI